MYKLLMHCLHVLCFVLQGYIWNVDSATNYSGVLHCVGALNGCWLLSCLKKEGFFWGFSNMWNYHFVNVVKEKKREKLEGRGGGGEGEKCNLIRRRHCLVVESMFVSPSSFVYSNKKSSEGWDASSSSTVLLYFLCTFGRYLVHWNPNAAMLQHFVLSHKSCSLFLLKRVKHFYQFWFLNKQDTNPKHFVKMSNIK